MKKGTKLPKKITYSSYLLSLIKSFDVSADDIERFRENFHNEMKLGLCDRPSSLKMLPAFIDRPTGREKGRYSALDLGGTNFRIIQVRLDGCGGAREEHVGRFVIPSVVRHGTGKQMFNFIAMSVLKFANSHNIKFTDGKKLGFTFSFPMKQTSIVSGILVNWTKDFSASGVVNKDVVALLADSFKRCGMKELKVAAIANDTVGTYAAGALKDRNCDVGIIFGTGTNACYREKIANIKKLRGHNKNAHMIINIEWGNFDKFPANNYDARLDKETNNPGKQKLEKIVSGLYLGEITRLVLTDLIKHRFMFSGGKARFPKGSFTTRHMSLIESDHTRDLIKIKAYLEEQGIMNTNIAERNLLREISTMVSTRAARISAAAISSVVTWMDHELKFHHSIAIDGSLYERHPGFGKTITRVLKDLHGSKSSKITLKRSKDGSGMGVAIIAAVASDAAGTRGA